MAGTFKRLVRRVKRALSRITSIGTPWGSISWLTKHQAAKLVAERPVLSPSDCAEILSLDEDVVIGLLEEGVLPGLKIGKNWRVTQDGLLHFLSEKQEETRLAILKQDIEDPATWARVLRSMPDQAETIAQGQFEEGTFGRFLQETLREYPDSSDAEH